MNYYTDDDKVAVILNDSYGSGWYTCHGYINLLFDLELAEAIDSQDWANAAERLEELDRLYPGMGIDMVQARELTLEWVTRGRKFIVYEYDGRETVWYKDQMDWIKA